MTTQTALSIPLAYGAYFEHTNPERFIADNWPEACDLLLAHVRAIMHKADFDFARVIPELDSLALRLGVYAESDSHCFLGRWLGCLDTAQHKPFVEFDFEQEDGTALCVPLSYNVYRAQKKPVKEMFLAWGEAADVLLSLIRLRAESASKTHQGFEDLVTWMDDLALSKGAEPVTPAAARSIRSVFGYDAFDMREAFAV